MKKGLKTLFLGLALLVSCGLFLACPNQPVTTEPEPTPEPTPTPAQAVKTITKANQAGDDHFKFVLYDDASFIYTNDWGTTTYKFKGIKGTYTGDGPYTLTVTKRLVKPETIAEGTFAAIDLGASASWENANAGLKTITATITGEGDAATLEDATWDALDTFSAYAYLDEIAIKAHALIGSGSTVPDPRSADNATAYGVTSTKKGTNLSLVIIKTKDQIDKLTGAVTYTVDDATTDTKKITIVKSDATSAYQVSEAGLTWSDSNTYGVVTLNVPAGTTKNAVKVTAVYVEPVTGATATATLDIAITDK